MNFSNGTTIKIEIRLLARYGQKEVNVETIRSLRKSLGLTQGELAKEIGKNTAYISDLESGKRDIAGIAAGTLVKLSYILGVTAEDIIDPGDNDFYDPESFEWDENDRLIVDGLYYDPSLNADLIRIDGLIYKLIRNADKEVDPSKWLRVVRKSYTEYMLKNMDESDFNYKFVWKNLAPRGGFVVTLRRAITDEEFEALKEKYNLTPNDITEPFIDTAGEIYGKKATRTFTAIQIRVNAGEAIPLEHELRDKGIEAFNGSPGRVNIRIK